MNYKLTLSYDGTDYHGWQRQHNAVTVQEILEDSLFRIFGSKITVTGCSRTDAGVHAKTYVCNFHGKTTIPVEKLHIVLNTMLPEDIRAYKCEEADEGFNARFDTVKKAYEYKILNSEVCDPLLRRFVWHYPIKLDFEKMLRASQIICGRHDFKSFCAAGSSAKTTVRNVMKLELDKNDNLIKMRIEADGFLYNMVRIIAGTLVYVGNGKLSTENVKEFLEKGDRRLMGITAPPQGLSLVEVSYE